MFAVLKISLRIMGQAALTAAAAALALAISGVISLAYFVFVAPLKKFQAP